MRTINEMVQQEVIYCVSSLICSLREKAEHFDSSVQEDLTALTTVADYESAAQEAGFTFYEDGIGWAYARRYQGELMDYEGEFTSCEDAAIAACEEHNVEPHYCEVYEHWIVTDWLADKLKAKGEPIVHDFFGMTVWGRSTTGQAISMDYVIEQIYKEHCK